MAEVHIPNISELTIVDEYGDPSTVTDHLRVAALKVMATPVFADTNLVKPWASGAIRDLCDMDRPTYESLNTNDMNDNERERYIRAIAEVNKRQSRLQEWIADMAPEVEAALALPYLSVCDLPMEGEDDLRWVRAGLEEFIQRRDGTHPKNLYITSRFLKHVRACINCAIAVNAEAVASASETATSSSA